jgi:alpha-glucosidase
VFLDIPYMDNYVDFTVNKTAFPTLAAFSDYLHSRHQRIIPIIDAAISAENISAGTYYDIGNKDDIFIKSNKYHNETYNHNLVNQVWPKVSVFVDWFNNKSTNMWFTGLNELYKELHYDGIWVDMNEPWGFQTGEIDPANPHWVPGSAENEATKRYHHPRCKYFRSIYYKI